MHVILVPKPPHHLHDVFRWNGRRDVETGEVYEEEVEQRLRKESVKCVHSRTTISALFQRELSRLSLTHRWFKKWKEAKQGERRREEKNEASFVLLSIRVFIVSSSPTAIELAIRFFSPREQHSYLVFDNQFRVCVFQCLEREWHVCERVNNEIPYAFLTPWKQEGTTFLSHITLYAPSCSTPHATIHPSPLDSGIKSSLLSRVNGISQEVSREKKNSRWTAGIYYLIQPSPVSPSSRLCIKWSITTNNIQCRLQLLKHCFLREKNSEVERGAGFTSLLVPFMGNFFLFSHNISSLSLLAATSLAPHLFSHSLWTLDSHYAIFLLLWEKKTQGKFKRKLNPIYS